LLDQAVPRPCPRPCVARREAVQQPDHRGRRARGEGLMGQKVSPIGLRLGINRTWDSRWFAKRDYADILQEDLKLRSYLTKRLVQAGVARVIIERAAKKARITLHSARPGVVIGKKGTDIDKLRGDLGKMTQSEVSLNIVE